MPLEKAEGFERETTDPEYISPEPLVSAATQKHPQQANRSRH